MSQWTHVNASIRFDSILGQGIITEKELGKMCKWEDKDTSHWEDSKLPCGSEGSIEYEIVQTGGENSMAAQVVVFAGDLRDYDDDKEILNYFKSITENKMIRSGILEIDVEYKTKLIFIFDSTANEWIKT